MDSAAQTNPVIEGDYIVWEDRRAGNLDIYMYEISTGKEKPVCTDPSPQKTPAISDGRIVWADGRIKGTNIFIYDIATGQEKTVSTASEYESNPSIDGNRIVWQDKRKGAMDIFMFTEDASETESTAGEKTEAETGSKAPLGIYPVSAGVIAAYLMINSGKKGKRKT
jgi:beta propeller repeat protein